MKHTGRRRPGLRRAVLSAAAYSLRPWETSTASPRGAVGAQSVQTPQADSGPVIRRRRVVKALFVPSGLSSSTAQHAPVGSADTDTPRCARDRRAQRGVRAIIVHTPAERPVSRR